MGKLKCRVMFLFFSFAFALSGDFALAQIDSVKITEGGVGSSGGGGDFKTASGIVTCRNPDKQITLRFIPYVNQFEFKQLGGEEQFRQCTPISQFVPTPIVSDQTISDIDNNLQKSKNESQAQSKWLQVSTLGTIPFENSRRQEIGSSNRTYYIGTTVAGFDCGGEKVYPIVDAAAVRYERGEMWTDNSVFTLSMIYELVLDNGDQIFRSSLDKAGHWANPKIEQKDMHDAKYVCSGFNSNFVGNKLGPKATGLDLPYILN